MTVNEALIILKELRDAYIESELLARFSDEYVERVVKKKNRSNRNSFKGCK